MTADASDLGWAPGHFPKSFVYDPSGDAPLTYYFVGFIRNDDGDIDKAVYRTDELGSAYSLIVYND